MTAWTDHVSGRWLRVRPRVAGLYVLRYDLREVIVTHFDPTAGQFDATADIDFAKFPGFAVADPEFLYALDDAPGYPRRADDRRWFDEARAKGWREWSER